MTAVLATRNMLGQHAPDHRQRALGVAAADQQRRRLDRFWLRSSETACGSRRPGQAAYGYCRAIAALAPQASRVHAPSPSIPSTNSCKRAVDVAVRDHLGCDRNARPPAARGREADWPARSEASRSPPGSARIGLAQQIRPRLRHAKADVPAAGMAHQIDRPGIQLFDEADDVGDVLRHQIVVADAVPMLRKEAPQAERDHAMLFRQRAQHGIPGAEIAERAMHAAPAAGRCRPRPTSR